METAVRTTVDEVLGRVAELEPMIRARLFSGTYEVVVCGGLIPARRARKARGWPRARAANAVFAANHIHDHSDRIRINIRRTRTCGRSTEAGLSRMDARHVTGLLHK